MHISAWEAARSGRASRRSSGVELAVLVRFGLVTSRGPVQYKGEDLDAARGPGLGCFRFQLVVLGVLIVLTPLSVAWRWPIWLSTLLLIAVLVLLLVAGQTVIFLLRLVAADRRSRRRPLASRTKTVGELDDEQAGSSIENPPSDEGPMRE